MALLPFVCQTCGTVYLDDRLTPGDGSIGALSAESVTYLDECDNCGGDLKLIPGTYSIASGVSRFLDGPPESKAQAAAFLRLLQRAQSGALTRRQFVTEVAAAAPELVPHVEKAPKGSRAFAMWATFLLPVLLVMCQSYQTERHHHEATRQSHQQHEEQMQQSEHHHREMMGLMSRPITGSDVEAVARELERDEGN